MMPYVWGKDLSPGGMQATMVVGWPGDITFFDLDAKFIPMICPGFPSRIPIWTDCISSVPTKKSLWKWHTQHSTIHNFARNILNWRFVALGSFTHHLAKAANPLMFVAWIWILTLSLKSQGMFGGEKSRKKKDRFVLGQCANAQVWSFGALLKFFILPLLVMHATLSTTSKEAPSSYFDLVTSGDQWGLGSGISGKGLFYLRL